MDEISLKIHKKSEGMFEFLLRSLHPVYQILFMRALFSIFSRPSGDCMAEEIQCWASYNLLLLTTVFGHSFRRFHDNALFLEVDKQNQKHYSEGLPNARTIRLFYLN